MLLDSEICRLFLRHCCKNIVCISLYAIDCKQERHRTFDVQNVGPPERPSVGRNGTPLPCFVVQSSIENCDDLILVLR